MFIGRSSELAKLEAFSRREVAGLAVVYGRRRIGKSSLIEYFSRGHRFLELYGLPPRECATNADQLKHFGRLMGKAFNVPAMYFENWFDALSTLAGLTVEGEYIILLDEISWLAHYDNDLPGILKGIWDTEFKKNKQLILFLCGSVSSWIENKILKDKGYVGRVSLQLKLEEMPLYDANQFWGSEANNISAMEKFKLLSVTGGVPRYLEEINPKQSAEENIKRFCYHPDGLLFNEFDTIFRDIFGKRDKKYRDIVKLLVNGGLEQTEICRKLGIEPSGVFSDHLDGLASAGFIRREYVWSINSKKSSMSKYRLCDNYLRFYLKYIEPKRDLIQQNLYEHAHLDQLHQWATIMGLQFENFVLNNLKTVIQMLNIAPETIISAAPYFQTKTTRQPSTQIDLLIHTQYTLYVCEIKFRKKIGTQVINEMVDKIKCLKTPEHLSVRPVLIYQGGLSDTVLRSNYFTHLIAFSDLLQIPCR
ncbi:MAG: ATP-binding protein [Coxiellaceae bacterium]|nr:ATP-binding protein [Coxiellaceae bacterium]